MATYAHVPTNSTATQINTVNANVRKTKNKQDIICCIATIACIMITVVIIFALFVFILHYWISRTTDYDSESDRDCGCWLGSESFDASRDQVCGIQVDKWRDDWTADECVNECRNQREYDSDDVEIFYIKNTTECYCDLGSNDSVCLNNSDIDNLVIQKWYYSCCVSGRRYNTEMTKDLLSDIKYMNCDEYGYYENDQWMEFMRNNNNLSDDKLMRKWQKQGLSEHASIGTFNKFTLQLMSIGAPLWMIQLSNEASLDEIRHSQISFDIANLYSDHEQCIMAGNFPAHSVDIDGDWNKIAMDTVFGGCFGETLSAFRMLEDRYDNIIDGLLYEMAMDEIKHASLAWISIKWMIDNSDGLEIVDQKWWKQQLRKMEPSNSEEKAVNIYEVIIPSIINKLWIKTSNHKDLYQEIVSELQSYFTITSMSNTHCLK